MVRFDKIHLLRNIGLSNSLWTTGLYSFTLWNSTLTQGDIIIRRQRGPPNSLPIVYNERVYVKQNGESELDHSNNAAYYAMTIPSKDLATITLRAYDYDDMNSGDHESSVFKSRNFPQMGLSYIRRMVQKSLKFSQRCPDQLLMKATSP